MEKGEASVESLTVAAMDGYELGATLFRPARPNGRAVQVHAAAGVRQEYYAPFAAYLAERGFVALTFDYRGVGRSAPADLKASKARIADWGRLDAPGISGFIEDSFSNCKRLVVAHSVGGPSTAIMPGNDRLDGLLAVASQSCYWRLWPGVDRAGIWFLTHVLLPVGVRAYGYFPGALLRQGENLPPLIALEWARWCRYPRYLLGALGPEAEAQAARFVAPMRLIDITDDGFYAPDAAGRALLDLFPNARKERILVRPEDAGVGRIGHFGFFKERFRDALWRGAVDWLERC
jgi:predicted alpha/beta hydrolase